MTKEGLTCQDCSADDKTHKSRRDDDDDEW